MVIWFDSFTLFVIPRRGYTVRSTVRDFLKKFLMYVIVFLLILCHQRVLLELYDIVKLKFCKFLLIRLHLSTNGLLPPLPHLITGFPCLDINILLIKTSELHIIPFLIIITQHIPIKRFSHPEFTRMMGVCVCHWYAPLPIQLIELH